MQLRSHLNVCLNVGLTPDELKEFVKVLREKVGTEEANLADQALKTVLQSRK
ncbi:carboxymuconolactone decarboxylase family protein [Parasutterella secunda]|uniref:carboxymuconolactone decarboxylase family protein n=1 Tax=Parasutterella secunda TaxID=626947 RepID=UPI001EF58795|nr:carboxymuconolactone decarboxylase family protein [Parasutterella secunda]